MTDSLDPQLLDEAIAAVGAGLVVGMPTDTVYGIAADPLSPEAIRRLFVVKGRQTAKPIPILAADLDGARRVGSFDADAVAAARLHWPGPLTLVVPRAEGLPDWVGSEALGTVGIRVPDHPVALALLSASGPLAVTSANRSGEPPAADAAAAEAALREAVAVYLPGAGAGGAPSTVVDLSGPEPRVLREGALDWTDPETG
jgi:tRNA threonylcarbamoyl adenosine modification protein (Sua5/YciO/YrdC/YwlC family)